MNQNKRKFKGVLSGFMATALTASFLPLPEVQAKNTSFYDVNSYDWYATSVERWSAAGIIHGTGDNLFSPDSNVTRGQIAVMINNVMGYEVESQALFSDLLDPSKYYYTPLRYLAAAGVMDGRTDGSMGSEDDVTREDAALMLCQAFHLEMSDTTSTSFADNYAISSYAMSAVVTLNEMGVLNGTPDKMVMPKGNLTRAEFATMLNALIKSLTYSGGTSSNPAAMYGTTIVNTASTIENTSINGDLILAPGISYGDVYLDDLSISGNIYVKGGGVDSIYVNDVDMLGEMVVGRDKDPVRVVFTGSSTLSTMKVQDDSIIDATALNSDGKVSDITIEGGENVEIIGTFDSLTNESPGVNLTISGSIAEIVMNADGTINGISVAAGTSFDSNSIPGLDVEEPEITLTHNYGTATEEEDNDPYAESEVMTIDFDATTGKVVATIRVEDEEDCVLMSENHNAITVYNPNDLASLNALELSVERNEYSSYTEFEVSFTMIQNYNEIPLSVNFKDKYAAPEVNIIMNYNDLPKAEAVYEITELDYNTSSETASGVITLTDIKYCEPHYSEKYVLTFDEELHEDLGFATTDIDYDADESTAEISFAFNGGAVDSIDLTVNMLKTDAADEIPTVKSYFYHDDDEAYESKIIYDYAELNAQGLMEVKIDLSLDSDWQLVTGSKAITIDADSGETEYGYGMSFDYELTHEGAISHYIITFEPNTAVEEVTFLVHVEDLDENIPVMSLGISEPRFTATTYAEINMNTRAYSRSNVTVEVAVDEEKIEEITGFELSNNVFKLYVDSAQTVEVNSYSITKLEDGLYQIKFEPEFTTTSDTATGTETSEVMKTYLCLDLEQTDDYISLYPVSHVNNTHGSSTETVPLGNLAYAVKADTSGKTIDVGDVTYHFDYSASVSFTSADDLSEYDFAGFAFDAESYDYHPVKGYIGLRLDPTYEDENGEDVVDTWDNYLESMYFASVSSTQLVVDAGETPLYLNTVVIYFESKPRVDPEDIRLNVYGVSTETNSGTTAEAKYNDPTVSIYGMDDSDYSVSAPSSTGLVTVTLTDLDHANYAYTFNVRTNDFDKIVEDSITYQEGDNFFTFVLDSSYYTTDSSNVAEIMFTMTESLIGNYPVTLSVNQFAKLDAMYDQTMATGVTATKTSEDLEEDTATYTVEFVYQGIFELDSRVGEQVSIEHFLIDDDEATGAKVTVDSVIANSKGSYTVNFTVNDQIQNDGLVLLILSQIEEIPICNTTCFDVSSGFMVVEETNDSPGKIVRVDTNPLTWELGNYQGEGDYTLTLATPLILKQGERVPYTMYYSDDLDAVNWNKVEDFEITDKQDGLDKKYYFSFNPYGVNYLEITISADVEADDIFMLSEDGVGNFTATESAATTWDLYKKAAEDIGFTYYTFDDGMNVSNSLTFLNGETLLFYTGTTVEVTSGQVIRFNPYDGYDYSYIQVMNGDLAGLYKNIKDETADSQAVLGFNLDATLKYTAVPSDSYAASEGKTVGDSVDATNAISDLKIDWQINKNEYKDTTGASTLVKVTED